MSSASAGLASLVLRSSKLTQLLRGFCPSLQSQSLSAVEFGTINTSNSTESWNMQPLFSKATGSSNSQYQGVRGEMSSVACSIKKTSLMSITATCILVSEKCLLFCRDEMQDFLDVTPKARCGFLCAGTSFANLITCGHKQYVWLIVNCNWL